MEQVHHNNPKMAHVIHMPDYKQYAEYKFKYLNENDIQRAIDKVIRQRLRARDEEIWSQYYEEYDKPPQNDRKEPQRRTSDKSEGCTVKPKVLTRSRITSVAVTSDESTEREQFAEKLNSVFIKIKNIIEIIKFHLYDFNIPDIPNESTRIQNKATEFCVRLSRNNLYQIELQYNQLLNADRRQTLKRNRFIVLKLYQNLFSALSTLQRHMHVIWGYDGIADKLNTLLQYTVKINALCRSVESIDVHLDEMDDVCLQMIESVKYFLNIRHPSELIRKNKPKHAIKSLQVSSVYSTAIPKRRKVQTKPTVDKRKRNVHSATTHDQYYMYHSKADKSGVRCNVCSVKNTKSSSEQNISRDFSRVLSGTRQGSYHKNCHHTSVAPKIVRRKLKDEPMIKVIHDVQDVSATNRSIESCESDSKNVKLVIIDGSNANEARNDEHRDSSEDRANKITRISDNLLDEEIMAMTAEIEAPLDQFLLDEIDDFSTFLYNTRI